MLQRTPPQAHLENQETGVRRIIRTFDPEVPGYIFWPICSGRLRSSSNWCSRSDRADPARRSPPFTRQSHLVA
jgi:hypothetical protein